MFASLAELLVYLQSLGYSKLVRRDGQSTVALSELLEKLPKRDVNTLKGSSGYEVSGL